MIGGDGKTNIIVCKVFVAIGCLLFIIGIVIAICSKNEVKGE